MFESGIHLNPETVRELPATIQLLDVREPWEHDLARLPGAVLIPLGQLAARARELDRNRAVVAYCHHGVRSLHALGILRRAGFQEVAHVAGGIDAYSAIDPSVPRY